MKPAVRLACLLVLQAWGGGCGPSLPYVWVSDLPAPKQVDRIRPGDTIAVTVKDQDQLSGSFTVRDNGTYLQPLVGEIEVGDMTPKDAAVQLAKLLEGMVVDPLVSVTIVQRRTLNISVLGEVERPGVVEVPAGEGMLGVLSRAGGLNDFASYSGIYVIRKEPKLMRIRFDYRTLVGGEERAVRFPLKDGDTVVVE